MLNVNTIEFGGRKAVINSYSDHPALVKSREEQLTRWKAQYPLANVQTERLTEADTVALVAKDTTRNLAYDIGQASLI